MRRTSRRFTIHDLIEACIEATAQFHPDDKSISKRTVQRDIKFMREELGAPIIVEDRKYYLYSDPSFSLESTPVTEDDGILLHEIRQMLQTYHEFQQTRELDAFIARIEQSIHGTLSPNQKIVELDHFDRVPGRQYVATLYGAISKQQPLLVTYRPFHDGQASEAPFSISPYLLKTYNSRWYALSYNHAIGQLVQIGLERIIDLQPSDEDFHPPTGIQLDRYFADRIGVSADFGAMPESVQIWVKPKQVAYVRSRPWHESQQEISQDESGMVIQLHLIINYELCAKILSFGPGVKVLSPPSLVQKIQDTVTEMMNRYTEEIQA
ncbi:WYL domain-containing protein [Pontibacter sp. G13]|uniref:helix-turn-helix transcriptional regulator n=1 Tax=Pontibacter sp. G13 TaxID=3074898 RepID=UPI002889FC8B|nr:WYL domain-containing protein [Pontibacter sp. G13]WNJ18618.1 WYL domain-containing protein [Pontibacter sp. G13]